MAAVFRSQAYCNASDLPPEFWVALMKNEPTANIILPFARKALDSPQEVSDDQLWIIQYDHTGKEIEFVLSCTHGSLGNYPIFVFTPKSSAQLAHDDEDGNNITTSLSHLVAFLLQQVPHERVFSVFSVAYVTETFADILCQGHGFQRCKESYYDATFTFCTRDTLNKSPNSFSVRKPDVSISLRRPADVTVSYLETIKTLCKDFASTSSPYFLNDEDAEKEARALIANQQVWAHMIREGNADWEIACIIATTRQSENVTAFTKVFTAERWRGYGCAQRLLHRACKEILKTKKRVVLYVGNGDDLAPARKAYDKVGFQGVGERQGQTVEGVERWLEIGFEGTTLGHW